MEDNVLAILDDRGDWSEVLEQATINYNNDYHSTIKLPPALAFYAYFNDSDSSLPELYKPALKLALDDHVDYESIRNHARARIPVRRYSSSSYSMIDTSQGKRRKDDETKCPN